MRLIAGRVRTGPGHGQQRKWGVRVPGRIEIDDVAPVVSAGVYPAKAVVGEVVPVRATVWREGHDAVAATLVVRYLGRTYPQVGHSAVARGRSADAEATDDSPKVKPASHRMSLGRTPDVFHGQFSPDRVGLWTFRVDGWGDPISTWRHAVTAKLDAGQGEQDLDNDLVVGAALLERAATGVPRRIGAVPSGDRVARAVPAARSGHPRAPVRRLGRPAAGPLQRLV
jgi:starch synthase (maltosyl-transferring)